MVTTRWSGFRRNAGRRIPQTERKDGYRQLANVPTCPPGCDKRSVTPSATETTSRLRKRYSRCLKRRRTQDMLNRQKLSPQPAIVQKPADPSATTGMGRSVATGPGPFTDETATDVYTSPKKRRNARQVVLRTVANGRVTPAKFGATARSPSFLTTKRPREQGSMPIRVCPRQRLETGCQGSCVPGTIWVRGKNKTRCDEKADRSDKKRLSVTCVNGQCDGTCSPGATQCQPQSR